MKDRVLVIGKWLITIVLGLIIIDLVKTNNELEYNYESYKKNGEYVNSYQSKTIGELKKQNRELYDSIKNKKDVKQAIIIKYRYVYKGDTIYIDRELPQPKDSVYTFSKKNDTISYAAKIKSSCPPEWVKVDFNINDKLTLINREKNGQNELTISTNGGQIDGTTVFNKDDKNDSFINRFSLGVNAGVGYGLINKKPDIYIGVGVSFRLNKK